MSRHESEGAESGARPAREEETVRDRLDTIAIGLEGGAIGTLLMTLYRMPATGTLPPTAEFWARYVGGGEPDDYPVTALALHFAYGVGAGGLFALELLIESEDDPGFGDGSAESETEPESVSEDEIASDEESVDGSVPEVGPTTKPASAASAASPVDAAPADMESGRATAESGPDASRAPTEPAPAASEGGLLRPALLGTFYGLVLSVVGEWIVLRGLLDIEPDDRVAFHLGHVVYGVVLGLWTGIRSDGD